MINYRLTSIFICFWIFCISIVFYSFYNETESEKVFKKQVRKKAEKSFFKKIDYYKIESNRPYLSLNAISLDITNQQYMEFHAPKGLVYVGEEQTKFKASSGIFESNRNHLSLESDVSIVSDKYQYESNNLFVDGDNSILVGQGPVKARLKDDISGDTLVLNGGGLRSYVELGKTDMFGGVDGKLHRKRKYEGGLDFKSEKISFDNTKSELILDKDVKIHRNNYRLSAGRGEVLLENFNKKLKYYTLYDDVKLIELVKLNTGEKQTRRAYAEKLEAFQSKGEVVLTGAPRVEQGNDVIKGYQIILRENVELVEIDDSQTSFSLKKKRKK